MKPPLQKLAESDWRHLRQDSTAIPGSLPGTERRCCKDGDLIEIFDRERHLIPDDPAVRFCTVADRLHTLGIFTVTPKRHYRLPDGRSALRYAPLAGETLHALMSRFEMPEHCIEDLGRLIASIHHGGIDAPSLRLRSVVLRADGELGLDDLAHCRLYRGGRPLPEADREENLRNLLSHADASLFEDRLRAAYRQSRPIA